MLNRPCLSAYTSVPGRLSLYATLSIDWNEHLCALSVHQHSPDTMLTVSPQSWADGSA